MIIWTAIAGTVVSFVLSLLATPLAARVAHRFHVLDVPHRHKAHTRPIPLLGGSAIFAAILGPSLLAVALASFWSVAPPSWLPEALRQHIPGLAGKKYLALGILGGALLLHIVGIIDDKKPLGPWLKLAAQLVVSAGVVIFLDVRIVTMWGPVASIILSILWLVAITNAFNFLDNMDGLAASVGAVVAAGLIAAAASVGQTFVATWVCLMFGAIVGFLPYNISPAKIFMGDAGSLVIGFLLAVASMLTTYVPPGLTELRAPQLFALFAPLVLMAVPLYDMLSVLVLRLREGRNPMVGDRRHFSHRLVRRGMSVRATVATITLCTIATAIAATLLAHVADAAGAILVFSLTVCILLVIAMLESSGNK